MSTALIDPKDFPADQVVLDLEGIQNLIPHRYEFTQFHSILHWDDEKKLVVGYRKAQDTEFWERGHIPGRPLLPGVLMVEAMAQVGVVQGFARFGMKEYHDWIGFAGVESVRFRGAVGPGEDLWIAGILQRVNPKRGYIKWNGQVIRGDGALMAEATILGMPF
ncbi:MAG: hypothetical protein HQ519_19495 [Planctomycetes bacterium]|nr:hypothetical protein [Planctomycetota bacterium]